MTSQTDPITTVALHWPFVRRKLQLSRARPIDRALAILAELQADSGGEAVRLGRSRLREDGLSPGETGAIYHALVELERRRVVARYRGSGRRPDAWSLRPDLRHWRRMPWGSSSAKDVEMAITSCGCSTFRAVAARIPGQSVALARRFWLSADDHLRPPGLFLVDSRGYGESRAANARRPGKTPVDSRGYGAGGGAPLLSFYEDVPSSSSDVEDDERMSILRGAVGQCWGTPLRRLHSIAAGITVDQAHAMAHALEAYRLGGQPVRSPSVRVELLEELAASPGIRAMAEA